MYDYFSENIRKQIIFEIRETLPWTIKAYIEIRIP